MQVEYVLLLIMATALVVGFIRLKWADSRARTWRQNHYANYCLPLIFEQRDNTPESAQSTITEYESCLSALSECGNKYLNPETQVHLWLYLADKENNRTDFARWVLENQSRRTKIFEPFIQQKAENMKGSPADLGRTIWGIENDN